MGTSTPSRPVLLYLFTASACVLHRPLCPLLLCDRPISLLLLFSFPFPFIRALGLLQEKPGDISAPESDLLLLTSWSQPFSCRRPELGLFLGRVVLYGMCTPHILYPSLLRWRGLLGQRAWPSHIAPLWSTGVTLGRCLQPLHVGNRGDHTPAGLLATFSGDPHPSGAAGLCEPGPGLAPHVARSWSVRLVTSASRAPGLRTLPAPPPAPHALLLGGPWHPSTSGLLPAPCTRSSAGARGPWRPTLAAAGGEGGGSRAWCAELTLHGGLSLAPGSWLRPGPEGAAGKVPPPPPPPPPPRSGPETRKLRKADGARRPRLPFLRARCSPRALSRAAASRTRTSASFSRIRTRLSAEIRSARPPRPRASRPRAQRAQLLGLRRILQSARRRAQ